MNRIVVFSAIIHHQSPIIIRAIAENFSNTKILVVLTPKIYGKGSIFKKIYNIISFSGLDYFLSMTAMSIFFKFKNYIEKKRKIPFADRNFIEVTETCKHYSNIEYFIVSNVNNQEAIGKIEMFNPDCLITVFFNQILGAEYFNKFSDKYMFNIHPSLLPEYKGWSPVFWVLANNEKTTGVTIHKLTEKIDGGKIITQEKIDISEDDSVFILYNKCAEIGGKLICGILQKINSSEQLIEIENTGGNTVKKITKAAVKKFRQKRGRFLFRFFRF